LKSLIFGVARNLAIDSNSMT